MSTGGGNNRGLKEILLRLQLMHQYDKIHLR